MLLNKVTIESSTAVLIFLVYLALLLLSWFIDFCQAWCQFTVLQSRELPEFPEEIAIHIASNIWFYIKKQSIRIGCQAKRMRYVHSNFKKEKAVKAQNIQVLSWLERRPPLTTVRWVINGKLP